MCHKNYVSWFTYLLLFTENLVALSEHLAPEKLSKQTESFCDTFKQEFKMIGVSKFAVRLSLLKRTPGSLLRLCSSMPNQSQQPQQPISKKDQLKRAVSQYGSTVIVFHVTISLASLGFFYLLVSRYDYCYTVYWI